ncbi:MAG: hypothetical protein J6Y36_07345 [Treponema sp.]|nr:hypothetical protein [Treponema sp.]
MNSNKLTELKEKIKDKRVFIPLIIFFCLIISGLSIFIIRGNSKNTVRIGFYQIPEPTRIKIQNAVLNMNNSSQNKTKIKFYISDKTKPFPINSRKCSIIFSYNSKTLLNLKSLNIPEKSSSLLPVKILSSVSNDKTVYAAPVLLDHFGLSLYKTYRTELNLKRPDSIKDLNQYLKQIREKASHPLVVIGSDDRELIGFVSAMTQSYFPGEQYKKICDKVSNTQKLSTSNLPDELKTVLDEIKKMKRNELIYPEWTKVTITDAMFLMKEHNIGAIASYISTQRTIPHVLVKYYESYAFPPQNAKADFGLIIPEICAVVLKDDLNQQELVNKLLSFEYQSELSKKTHLAPSALKGESFDSISDDVRFFAAASPEGPLMPMDSACFTDPDRVHYFASILRSYIEN